MLKSSIPADLEEMLTHPRRAETARVIHMKAQVNPIMNEQKPFPMAADENSWRTPSYRKNIVAKLDEAIQNSGMSTNRNSSEMENHVFQKAKTKEDYMNMIAKLILHIREINTKKAAINQQNQQQAQNQQGLPNTPGQPGQNQPNSNAQMAPDPINALQNLATQGSRPNQMMNMGPQGQMQSQPGMNQNPAIAGALQNQLGQQGQMVSQGQNPPITATNLLQTLNQRPQLVNMQLQNKLNSGMGMMNTQQMGNPGLMGPGMGPMSNQMAGQLQNQLNPNIQNQMMPNMSSMQVPLSSANTMSGQMQGGHMVGAQMDPSGLQNPMQGQMQSQMMGGMGNNQMMPMNISHMQQPRPKVDGMQQMMGGPGGMGGGPGGMGGGPGGMGGGPGGMGGGPGGMGGGPGGMGGGPGGMGGGPGGMGGGPGGMGGGPGGMGGGPGGMGGGPAGMVGGPGGMVGGPGVMGGGPGGMGGGMGAGPGGLAPGYSAGPRSQGPFFRQSPSPSAPSPAAMGGPSPVSMGVMGGTMASPLGVTGSPALAASPSGHHVPVHMQRPGSGAPGPGPGTGVAGSPSAVTSPHTEDAVYREKVRQLSKYIEPLRRMISRMVNDGENVSQLTKMKNLLNILSNPTKRMPLETLLKCEVALEKLDFKRSEGAPLTHSGLQIPGYKEHQIFNPLLEVVNNCLQSPHANHTLKRTFGPCIEALNGPDISNPPLTKQIKLEEPQPEIPDVLQGEIARLDSRFKVSLETSQLVGGSGAIRLVAHLDDYRLPCVPPVLLSIPRDYPASPPTAKIFPHTSKDDESVSREIERAMQARISRVSKACSVGQLLLAWEMAVRQAASPNNPYSTNSDQVNTQALST